VHPSVGEATARPFGVMDLEPDDPPAVGGYRLVGRLGVGGMATVYLGERDGWFAVKLIHRHLASDVEFRARFAGEVDLARRVPDFCTAPVRDRGIHEGRLYLVTDYLDGMPLHRLVDGDGPLDPPTLHALATGVASALAAIHEAGLVHRDLKPSNVMVTLAGVRIIDFGIARALDNSPGYTRTGLVMGSLGWASPEQLDGADPVPAMDVFGWGCLVAFAATGRHPFGGADATSRSWQILHGEPNLDGVPRPLRDLVAAALRKNAKRRPSAVDLVKALGAMTLSPRKVRPAVRSDGVRPQAPGGPGRAKRKLRPRHKLAMLVAGLPLALAFVLAAASSVGDPFWFGGQGAGAEKMGPADRTPAHTGPSVTPTRAGDGARPGAPNEQGGSGAPVAPAPVGGPVDRGVPGGPPVVVPETSANTPDPTATDPGGNGGGRDPGKHKGKSKAPKPKP
jgi:hypothetical protein